MCEDLASMIFVDLQPGFGDLIEVLDLIREPRIRRIGDRPQHPHRLATEHLFRQAPSVEKLHDAKNLSALLRGESPVTPMIALLLARFFQTSPEFWMNLQTQHDLWMARRALAAREK